jgi:hypothetical protein
MDKNLAAFIREDTTTVGVRFFQEPWNRKDSEIIRIRELSRIF